MVNKTKYPEGTETAILYLRKKALSILRSSGRSASETANYMICNFREMEQELNDLRKELKQLAKPRHGTKTQTKIAT